MDKYRLMEFYKKAGYTQETFAKAIGMSKNALNSKLNGRGCFDLDEVNSICTVLSITDATVKAQIFLR